MWAATWILIIASTSSNTSASYFPASFRSESSCNVVREQVIQKSKEQSGMAYLKGICVRVDYDRG